MVSAGRGPLSLSSSTEQLSSFRHEGVGTKEQGLPPKRGLASSEERPPH